MKECWINVYQHESLTFIGSNFYTRNDAALWATATPFKLVYRIHVKLK